jgi:hypothetical protein
VASASNTSKVGFPEANGSYDYQVGAIPGYKTAYDGVASVYGVTVVHLTFVVAKYRFVFTETGLLPGTTWTVTVGTTAYTGNGSKIVVLVANGTYNFTVNATGSSASPGSGTTTFAGHGANQAIRFS